MTKPLITKSILRNAIWNFIVIILIYIIFHVFAFLEINKIAYDELSKRIFHEIEHLQHFITLKNDQFILESDAELQETDFQEFTDNAFFLQIYRLDSSIVLQSNNIIHINKLPIFIPQLNQESFNEKIEINNFSFLVCYKNLYNEDGNRKFIIQLASPNTSVNNMISEFTFFTVITFPFILLLMIFLSYALSRKTYNSLNNIIELAEEISAQNINKRLTYKADSNDVYGRLKETLNSLFDRLEKQINHIKEFSDNASHQLMSPLTSIKTELEYICKKEREIEDYKKTNLIVQVQAEKMISMVKTLLMLSRVTDELSDKRKIFNLKKVIADVITKNFHDAPVILSSENDIHIRGNEGFFGIAILNLIENGLKFSSNKKVEITNERIGKNIFIKIVDEGIGISEIDKVKIFNRFYRGNNSSQNIKGFGLGLSLVKSIIISMDGEINIENNKPFGTVVIIKLPSIIFD